MNSLANKIYGIIPPVITPLKEDATVDEKSTYRLLDYLIEGGINCLYILGTTGEGPLMPLDTQYKFTKIVAEYASDVPILVGVSDVSTEKVLNNINNISNLEVDAYVSTLPFYYQTNVIEQIDHFSIIAEKSNKPLVLYDIPKRVGTKISSSVVLEMANHDNVAGLKDSSGDLRNFRFLIEKIGDDNSNFSFTLGDSSMIDVSVFVGGQGVVPSDAHLFPELCVNIYNQAKNGMWLEARDSQRELNKKRKDAQDKFADVAMSGCKFCKRYLKNKGIINNEKSLRL